MLKEQFPQVLLIENGENVGFGRANNIGTEIANGEYLFFINTDTILLNNSVFVLFDFNENNKSKLKIGISGGILIDEDRLETGSFGPLPCKINILKSILGILPHFTKMNSIETNFFKINRYLEVGYVNGADMFVLKSTFIEIGGFDPNIFMYYEESDLQKRLNNYNYKNYIIEGVQIIHIQGASLNKSNSNNQKRLIVTQSMFYYFRKHSSKTSFYLFKYLYLILRLPTMLDKRYTWKEKKEYIMQIIKS
jgi:GT2 family glycosyltransferase